MAQQCSICLCGLADNLAITKCEHIFHQDCIARWLNEKPNNPKCPQCRTKLKKKKIIRFRLNPLQLVLAALEKPAEYVESHEGENRTKIQLAFAKLQSGEGPGIVPPSNEEVGADAARTALAIMRKKIEQLKSQKMNVEVEKEEMGKEVYKQKMKIDQMHRLNSRVNSQFSLESQKNRQLVEESIRLKKKIDEGRKMEMKSKRHKVEITTLQEKIAQLKHIEDLKNEIPTKEVKRLNELLEGKKDKEALKIVKDFYLYLRSEHTQLQKELKNRQETEQGNYTCLREQASSYRDQNNSLRRELSLQSETLKKYKTRIKKMESEKRKKESSQKRTPSGDMNSSTQSIETPVLSTLKGDFLPLKFDSTERSKTELKQVKSSPKQEFTIPQGRLKRKNPFAMKKKKRKPLRL